MTRSEMYMVTSGWLLINFMAGYGAYKLLGIYTFVYVAFFFVYLYCCSQIGGKK